MAKGPECELFVLIYQQCQPLLAGAWREGERIVLICLGFNCRDDIPLADS